MDFSPTREQIIRGLHNCIERTRRSRDCLQPITGGFLLPKKQRIEIIERHIKELQEQKETILKEMDNESEDITLLKMLLTQYEDENGQFTLN